MASLEAVISRSESALQGNLNKAVEYGLRQLVIRCYNRGVNIRITSGYRSFSEQNLLYSQGRIKTSIAKGEKIVTNARGGESMHNYGLAGDFVLIDSGYDMKADVNKNGVSDWLEVAAQAKLLGFEWGGDWITFKDNPHIQMAFGFSIKQLQAGQQPSAAQVQAAIDKIKKLEAEEDMSKELEAKVQVLSEALEGLEGRTVALEKRVNIKANQNPPAWAYKALEAAKAAGAITTTNDKNQDNFVMLQMLYNMGLFNPNVIKLLEELAAKEDGQ